MNETTDYVGTREEIRYARFDERCQIIDREMATVRTCDQASVALGISRERLRQLMKMGELPIGRVARFLVGGPDVVDPGVTMSPLARAALLKVPSDLFSARILGLYPEGLGELEREGILRKSTLFHHKVHQLTPLGQWVMSCLNITPASSSADQLPKPPANHLRPLREYVLALAEAAGEEGITAYLVNMAAGNINLPRKARLELVVVALAKSGYLTRIATNGRSNVYVATERGRRWLSPSGVKVVGLQALLASLPIGPRIAKGAGLPPGAAPVGIVVGTRRARTPLAHFGTLRAKAKVKQPKRP